MDLYKDDKNSLPAKAEGIRAIAQALGVNINVATVQLPEGVDFYVAIEDAEGNAVPLYPTQE